MTPSPELCVGIQEVHPNVSTSNDPSGVIAQNNYTSGVQCGHGVRMSSVLCLMCVMCARIKWFFELYAQIVAIKNGKTQF